MELSRSFQISTDYKDHRNAVNWEIFQVAEVIFVDRTHPTNRPLLYLLSDHHLSLDQLLDQCKSQTFGFSRDSFILLGEILSVDKKKKQISMTNKNIVAYNHLVIASGKKPFLSLQDEELTAALQALSDALRFKNTVPFSFPTSLKNPSKLIPSKKETTFAVSAKAAVLEERIIEKAFQPYIKPPAAEFNACHPYSFGNRFYEVQI